MIFSWHTFLPRTMLYGWMAPFIKSVILPFMHQFGLTSELCWPVQKLSLIGKTCFPIFDFKSVYSFLFFYSVEQVK